MEYAAAGSGGYYYYQPSHPHSQQQPQPQTLRRRPRPAARWVKQWIPQDLASPGAKCALFKWVREDVYRNLKENPNGPEPEAQARKPEPATEILFLCSYENCGKTFVDVAALRKHAHVHGERQYICPEPGCGKKFVDSSKLKRHNLTHTGQKDFICPHPGCGKVGLRGDPIAFSLDFNLRAHLKTHALENYHVCPFPACGKRFTSDYKLKCHVKAHEKTGSPVAVQHTPPAEKQQNTIKPSTQAAPKPSPPVPATFSADRPYVCPYEGCGKAYIHGYKLNLHFKTQHPEHSQDESGRLAAPPSEYAANQYSYAEVGEHHAPNPKRSKTNPAHKAVPPSKPYNVKISSRMSADTSGAKNQWPGKGIYDDDSEETEEDHGGNKNNNVHEGWKYGNQNADDEETEEDES